MWPLKRGTRNGGSGATALLDAPPPATVDDYPGELEELLAEIGRLGAANRRSPSPLREREVMRLRHLAGARLVLADRSPPAFAEPDFHRLPLGDPIPEVAGGELTPGLIRAGILRHGCLLVRGLIDREQARGLAEAIERSFCERDLATGGRRYDTDYYREFETLEPFALTYVARAIVAQCCGLSIVDAPRPAYGLLELFETTGITELVAGYLGDRPVISAQKTTLRKVDPIPGSAWHQDARAFGAEVHALNVWLPLSRCGDEAPGLDIVPRRLDELVTVGTDDAFLPGQVSNREAASIAAATPIVRPVYEPGDALLFDELLLHSTSFDPAMRNSRLGLECWFFAGAGFPGSYTPIAV